MSANTEQIHFPKGSRLGPYEISSSIGAGGMGEVFRAQDTRLHRDVAVKVLPKEFVADADRLRRFEQEAKTLAALNHPNVLTIHDAGVHEGAPYLVSELLEGKTLREEMSGNALPVRKATDYALQIANGLAAAHGKGVVHRDLKPENIFVTKDGRVKILDFGLAKLKEPSPGLRPPSPLGGERHGVRGDAATIRIDPDAVVNTTEPGLVLGTPAYMSPEQVRGEPADHRADIFAFGCVIYEMLSGARAFRRDTPVASMNAVLSEEPPPLGATNPNIPPALERTVHRCLDKQPERRFQSAQDLAFAIEALGGITSSAQLAGSVAGLNMLRAVPWAIAVLAIIVALGTFFSSRRASSTSRKDAAPPTPLRKFEIRIPLPKKNSSPRVMGLAISPDGRKLAYANADGLWIRRLDQVTPPVLIAASEKVTSPFWSPQSTDIAWFEEETLKRAPAAGGRAVTVCRFNSGQMNNMPLNGGAWLDNGQIIFASGFAGLYQVSAEGGNPQVALALAEDERDYHDASALPNGRGVIFVVHRREGDSGAGAVDTIATWSPQSGKKVLFRRPDSDLARPVFSAPGHVIFTDIGLDGDGNLWALPISLSTLPTDGEPIRLNEGGFLPSASSDGTLALLHRRGQNVFVPRQLVWVDRTGTVSAPFGPVQKGLLSPRLSPDERFVAFSAGENQRAVGTFILDVATGVGLPLPPVGETERNPFWLPNGRDLAVFSLRTNRPAGVIRPVEGSGAADEIAQGVLLHLSQSGRYAFIRRGPRVASIVTNCYVNVSGDRAPTPLPRGSPNLLEQPRLRLSLSPDDTILAFESAASGQNEIWAVNFPDFTNRVSVSRGRGGINPCWSRDGKELFYLSDDGRSMMSAPVVRKNGSRPFGEPTKLFDLPVAVVGWDPLPRSSGQFDVSADGQRFLMTQFMKDPDAPEFAAEPTVLLIENWFVEVQDKK